MCIGVGITDESVTHLSHYADSTTDKKRGDYAARAESRGEGMVGAKSPPLTADIFGYLIALFSPGHCVPSRGFEYGQWY